MTNTKRNDNRYSSARLRVQDVGVTAETELAVKRIAVSLDKHLREEPRKILDGGFSEAGVSEVVLSVVLIGLAHEIVYGKSALLNAAYREAMRVAKDYERNGGRLELPECPRPIPVLSFVPSPVSAGWLGIRDYLKGLNSRSLKALSETVK